MGCLGQAQTAGRAHLPPGRGWGSPQGPRQSCHHGQAAARPVKFGYFTLTDNPPGYGERRRDPNQFLMEVLEEAVHADEIGLNSVWLPEHHFGLFGILGATSTALGYLAAKTKRVLLAPATTVLPCNHPIQVAEQFNTLDLLSDGRAVFSAGRGYDRREYEAFGVPFEESRERFDEGMLLVQKAMAEENF